MTTKNTAASSKDFMIVSSFEDEEKEYMENADCRRQRLQTAIDAGDDCPASSEKDDGENR